jgi:hypothetical protein
MRPRAPRNKQTQTHKDQKYRQVLRPEYLELYLRGHWFESNLEPRAALPALHLFYQLTPDKFFLDESDEKR